MAAIVYRTYVIALLLAGVPALSHGEPVRVSLAPADLVNVEAAEGARLRRLLQQVLEQTYGVKLGRVLEGPAALCELREAGCLGRLRRELDSERLAVLRLGRLGDTMVIRLTVYDLERRARQGSWQEVLRRGAGEHGERQALQRMVAGFAPQPPPPSPRWYTRWWVWTAVGVAVAGGVTAAVLLTREGDVNPDQIIVPP